MADIKPPKMRSLASEKDVKPKKGLDLEPYDDRPSISFSETELPEIEDWKMDGKYKIIVEVEMTGIRKEDWGRNKGKSVGQFKINAVGVLPEVKSTK